MYCFAIKSLIYKYVDINNCIYFWLNENPKFTLFSLLHGFWSCSYKMSQSRAGVSMRASPLTNGKLLAALKGRKPCRITITEVNNIGDRYMQKASSIRFGFIMCWRQSKVCHYFYRRFSSSVLQVRLEQREVRGCRKPDSLAEFEKRLFDWPSKEEPALQGDEAEMDVEEEDTAGVNPCVTRCGRPTGKNGFGKTFLKQNTKSLWLPTECFSNVWIVQILIFKVNFN